MIGLFDSFILSERLEAAMSNITYEGNCMGKTLSFFTSYCLSSAGVEGRLQVLGYKSMKILK